jgi:hypothetical protein
MQVDFSLFCDAATITPTGLISMLDGGYDVTTVTSLPFIPAHMCLLVRITFEPSECGRTHTMTVRVLGPKGNLAVAEGKIQMEVPISALRSSGRNNYTCKCDFSGLQFDEVGEYSFNYFFADAKIGQAVLAIRKE